MINLDIEKSYNGKVVAGIDEVGRGPLAGPVVAAAVIIDSDVLIDGIKDSKQISPKKREKLAEQINSNYSYGIGEASVSEIDELNILNATKLAIVRAAQNLPIEPDIVLVDGNMKFDDESFKSIIKGDAISKSIAAASIIAKVYRDDLMQKLADIYPQYGWEKNVGYGTPTHIAAIKQYGPVVEHREKFISKIDF